MKKVYRKPECLICFTSAADFCLGLSGEDDTNGYVQVDVTDELE